MKNTVLGFNDQDLLTQDPASVFEWTEKLREELFSKNPEFNYLIVLEVIQLNFEVESNLGKKILWCKSAILLSQYLHLLREDDQYLGIKYSELNMAIRGVEKIGSEFCNYYSPIEIFKSIKKHVNERKIILDLTKKIAFERYTIDKLRSLKNSKLFLGLAMRLDKLCPGVVPESFKALFPKIPFLP